MLELKWPAVQVALDLLDKEKALTIASEAVRAAEGQNLFLEIGTPLLMSHGIEAINEFVKRFPQVPCLLDTKLFDVPAQLVKRAAELGAKAVTAMSLAPIASLEEAVAAAKEAGVAIWADLLGAGELLGTPQGIVWRGLLMEELNFDGVIVHRGISEQASGGFEWEELEEVCRAVRIPVGAAGGLNAQTVPRAIQAGASWVIVGSAVHSSPDPFRATRQVLQAVEEAARRRRVEAK
jgi:3-hexulose-6-phosphate synthase/6-phospho-3-hexuloisomerase